MAEGISSQSCEEEMPSLPSADGNTSKLDVDDDGEDDQSNILEDLMSFDALENVAISSDWSVDFGISCYAASLSMDAISSPRTKFSPSNGSLPFFSGDIGSLIGGGPVDLAMVVPVPLCSPEGSKLVTSHSTLAWKKMEDAKSMDLDLQSKMHESENSVKVPRPGNESSECKGAEIEQAMEMDFAVKMQQGKESLGISEIGGKCSSLNSQPVTNDKKAMDKNEDLTALENLTATGDAVGSTMTMLSVEKDNQGDDGDVDGNSQHKPLSALLKLPFQFSFIDRISVALKKFLGFLSMSDVLAQVWLPRSKLSQNTILTTEGQPYLLCNPVDRLSSYREISSKYTFLGEEGEGGFHGLPGRVFQKRLPEWTPNVQFYTKDEYLRVYEAEGCNVRGSLAVPVMEKANGKCLAVIELVLLLEKIEYKTELEGISEALKVHLLLIFWCSISRRLIVI
jgi:hypothetical protein